MADTALQSGGRPRLGNGQLRQRVFDALGNGGAMLARELAAAAGLPAKYGQGYLRRLARQGWLEAGRDAASGLPGYRLSGNGARYQLSRQWSLRQTQQGGGAGLTPADHVPAQQPVQR